MTITPSLRYSNTPGRLITGLLPTDYLWARVRPAVRRSSGQTFLAPLNALAH
jgi:hypothetical protein